MTGIMLTPDLYRKVPAYSWELAELLYEHAPDPVKKLIGGLLYAKVLEVEGAQVLKKPVVATLERLLAEEDILSSDRFIRFDPARDAGYFVDDAHHSFVFKRTTPQEADALAAIASIALHPSMTHLRIAARFNSYFSDQHSGLRVDSREKLRAVLDEAKADPRYIEYLEIPCVKAAGLVLHLPGNKRLISMHHEGETVAAQLDAAETREEKMQICETALTMLGKFHLLITENMVTIGGRWYPSPEGMQYEGKPAIPEVNYRKLLERRLCGTREHPRLGQGACFEDILDAVDDLGAFLKRGCVGAILQDSNDFNITKHGVIDVAELSIGNFLYDVAHFLYGNSFARKKTLDISALREHYISTLIRVVSDTEVAHNSASTEDFEKRCQEYGRWKSRAEIVDAIKPYWEYHTRKMLPSASAAFVEVYASHTVLDMVLGWDCCKPDAAERMREYCQAAAILVCMGETGALVHQLSYAPLERRTNLEQELQFAISNGLTLMRRQGFIDLASNWQSYLALSKKIPDAYLVAADSPVCFENALIPDLATRVVTALYSPPKRSALWTPHGLQY